MTTIYLHWFFYGDPFLHRRGKQPGRQELRPQKQKTRLQYHKLKKPAI